MSTPNETDIVVLAAGRGSRMGGLGEATPKWLLPVGDGTIADRHLDGIEIARGRVPGAIRSVNVVTGHAAEEIERFIAERDADVGTIHNPDYARLNNWFSVLMALEWLGESAGRRTVFINSDLFARAEWLADFIVEATQTEHEALIAVDVTRELTDESMKVSVRGGRPETVDAIGKVGVEGAVGEYVGLLMVRNGALERFHGSLVSFVGRPEHDDEWYERAVGLTAADGVGWVVHATPDGEWVEIDDDGDHEFAGELAARA